MGGQRVKAERKRTRVSVSSSRACRGNLADWRGKSGDAAGAADAFAELLADQEKVLGPDHPDTLGTRNHLANWREEPGGTNVE
ncbi:tetratricopeptide repeat protein [Streptomyces sp. E11-3]|uniref:tetratricopeptide repeat protein n=1 Tax=Streptomyces sp. E11-3 TaxID=3110112 RepID=UPI00397F0829